MLFVLRESHLGGRSARLFAAPRQRVLSVFLFGQITGFAVAIGWMGSGRRELVVLDSPLPMCSTCLPQRNVEPSVVELAFTEAGCLTFTFGCEHTRTTTRKFNAWLCFCIDARRPWVRTSPNLHQASLPQLQFDKLTEFRIPFLVLSLMADLGSGNVRLKYEFARLAKEHNSKVLRHGAGDGCGFIAICDLVCLGQLLVEHRIRLCLEFLFAHGVSAWRLCAFDGACASVPLHRRHVF
jgi:hypothetical protein